MSTENQNPTPATPEETPQIAQETAPGPAATSDDHPTPQIADHAPAEAQPAPQPAPAPPAEPWLSTSAAPLPPVPSRPPVRWSGVVWGLLLIAFSATTLWVISSPERLRSTADWFTSLTPGTALALWVALLGAIIAISAALGGISAAQRRRRRTPA